MVGEFTNEVLNTSDDFDCLMSVTENRGDFWQWDGSSEPKRLFPNAARRQQDREPLYEENSAIYITSVEALQNTGSILGGNVRIRTIPQMAAYDINTEEDFLIAESIAAKT